MARKQWLAGHLRVKGTLVLDEGAVRVLRERGSSLLAVGVRQVSGHFKRGEIVACASLTGEEVARGLINYDSGDVQKLWVSHPVNLNHCWASSMKRSLFIGITWFWCSLK